MNELKRAVESLEKASEALTGFVKNMRYLVESQFRMEVRQKRIHGAVMVSLIPLGVASIEAVNYLDLQLMDRSEIFHYTSTEVELDEYPIGESPYVFSTSEWYWDGQIAVEYDEHLRCDANGDGTYSLFASRPEKTSRSRVGPTPLMRSGPWPVDFTKYPKKPMACCVQSDISATVRRLGLSVTKEQTVNATCNEDNIFRYVDD